MLLRFAYLRRDQVFRLLNRDRYQIDSRRYTDHFEYTARLCSPFQMSAGWTAIHHARNLDDVNGDIAYLPDEAEIKYLDMGPDLL